MNVCQTAARVIMQDDVEVRISQGLCGYISGGGVTEGGRGVGGVG